MFYEDPTFSYYFMRVFNVLMVIAPNIGFIAQIFKFRKSKSSEGFSKFLSLTILTSNVLRIYFWLGKRFAIPLLLQSIVSVFMQMTLMNQCLKYSNLNTHIKENNSDIKNSKTEVEIKETTQDDSNNNNNKISIRKPFLILDLKNFWNWPYLVDYIYIVVLLSLVLGILSNIIGLNNSILVESFGIGAACFEAIVGIPQIIQNYKRKSTENLSIFMIFTWASGDIIKTIYYVKTGSPLQLICTGSFQMTTDTILIFQIIYFYKNTKKIIEYRRLSNIENTEMANKRNMEIKEKQMETVSSANTEVDSKINEDVTNIV
jgi:solute carrier family 66, member 2